MVVTAPLGHKPAPTHRRWESALPPAALITFNRHHHGDTSISFDQSPHGDGGQLRHVHQHHSSPPGTHSGPPSGATSHHSEVTHQGGTPATIAAYTTRAITRLALTLVTATIAALAALAEAVIKAIPPIATATAASKTPAPMEVKTYPTANLSGATIQLAPSTPSQSPPNQYTSPFPLLQSQHHSISDIWSFTSSSDIIPTRLSFVKTPRCLFFVNEVKHH
jgi:hypothetical protein